MDLSYIYFIFETIFSIVKLLKFNAMAKDFITSGNKIIIPYSEGMHDTFKVDRYGNLYGGHTTVNLENNGKLRINTDPLTARKDNSFK